MFSRERSDRDGTSCGHGTTGQLLPAATTHFAVNLSHEPIVDDNDGQTSVVDLDRPVGKDQLDWDNCQDVQEGIYTEVCPSALLIVKDLKKERGGGGGEYPHLKSAKAAYIPNRWTKACM
jgi:hypothetical protein